MFFRLNKFVVYTVQTGGYDQINQPSVVDDRFDYVLFTDKIEQTRIGIWQVRSIPYVNDDKTRLSRYPKMHPKELLADYVASLYVDANVQITGQCIYDRCVELYEQSVDWAGNNHPYRDCIYDEAYFVYGLDTEENIFCWCHRLRKEGYPRHHGLFENNVIFRVHNERTKQVDAMWWQLYEQYTRRDQLTLFYVLWKYPKVKTGLLLPMDELNGDQKPFQVLKHTEVSRDSGRRGLNQTFWEHARCRCRYGIIEKEQQFREFHYWLYGLNPFAAKVFLYLWGFYAILVYGPIAKYRASHRRKQCNSIG